MKCVYASTCKWEYDQSSRLAVATPLCASAVLMMYRKCILHIMFNIINLYTYINIYIYIIHLYESKICLRKSNMEWMKLVRSLLCSCHFIVCRYVWYGSMYSSTAVERSTIMQFMLTACQRPNDALWALYRDCWWMDACIYISNKMKNIY